MTARRPAGGRGDDGVTLVEVLIAMTIMTTFLVIMTGAVLQVYRSTGTGQSRATTQTQLHLAVQRLDQSLRYASAITAPNTTAIGGAWYVEYLGVDPTSPGQTQCTQLRLTPAGVLQLISWTPGSPPAPGALWQTVASQIILPGAGGPAPFERQLAGSATAPFTADFQRLRLRLIARDGNSQATTDVTFTALNTSRDTPSSNVCSEGRPSS